MKTKGRQKLATSNQEMFVEETFMITEINSNDLIN